MTTPATARLLRHWPEIIATLYEGRPELIEANSGRDSALAWLRRTRTPEFTVTLGAPNGGDQVAMAYLCQAITAMCAMDHDAALRLIDRAVNEIKAGNFTQANRQARGAEMRKAQIPDL
jgi:hypothetical protein